MNVSHDFLKYQTVKLCLPSNLNEPNKSNPDLSKKISKETKMDSNMINNKKRKV